MLLPGSQTIFSIRGPGADVLMARVRGSVLLEVVLALALFVGAATVISSGLNASVEAVYRLRLQTHASNLAISTLSEMQMHLRPIEAAGPEPFAPPFEDWTWQIEVGQPETSSLDADAMRKVEVIIRHSGENIVHRLTHFMRASDVPPQNGSGGFGNPAIF